MAHASSSKMTLDDVGVLLAASLAGHTPPHRQTSALQLKSSAVEEEDDYGSDGICTPPIPSYAPSLNSTGDYFASHDHTHFHTSTNTLNSARSSSANRTLPRMTPNTLKGRDYDPLLNNKVAYIRSNDDEDSPYLETVVVKLEREDPVEFVVTKRRGRPLGSTKAKKLLQDKARKLREALEDPVASSSQKSFDEGGAVPPTSPLQASVQRVDGGEQPLELDIANPPLSLEDQNLLVQTSPAMGEEELERESLQEVQRPVTPKQALLPDFVFEPVDDLMFDELRAFLDQEEVDNTESSSEEGGDNDNISQEDYERKRLQRLRRNEKFLSKLGLGGKSASPVLTPDIEEEEEEAPTNSPARSYYRKKNYRSMTRSLKIDADGLTLSLPLPGCTQEVGCVDIPVLRPRIRLQHIFHDDVPILPPMPDLPSEDEWQPSPSPSPAKKVTKMAPLKRSAALTVIRRGCGGEAIEGRGTTCHQCRNKTEEPKMRCRYHENGRVCPLYWCQRCLNVRYGIEWDEESRTFHCPRCLAFCNCSLCIRKAGLSKISSGLGAKLRDSEGNQKYASVRHYLDAKVGRPVKIGPGGLHASMPVSTMKPTAEKQPDTTKKVTTKTTLKRKVPDETTPIEPKKKRQYKKKVQAQVVHGGGEEWPRPVSPSPEGETYSRSRKIKLTFKAKATAEDEEERRQRIKHDKGVRSVNVTRGRTVTFAKPTVITARRGKPLKKSVPQIIEAAHVWVKSKADVVPSSSDSELEESTWRTVSPDEDEGSDEEMEEERDYRTEDSEANSEFGDGAGQDRDGGEESSSMQDTADSPQAGQIEYSHHPELTMTEYPISAPHSIFQSSGLIPFVEDSHAAFPPPGGPELTEFIQHLMGAGFI